MRHERKYKVENYEPEFLRQFVKMLPFAFSEEHPPRWVNNIYFDTPDLRNAKENQEGLGARHKNRVRWYGDDWQTEAVLELKIKLNLIGKKHKTDLQLADFQTIGELTDFVNYQLAHAQTLIPTLANRYFRTYFTTPDGKFRITLDDQLWQSSLFDMPSSKALYDLLNVRPFFWMPLQGVILEMKYQHEHEAEAAVIAQKLPFRLYKNSKYVDGLEKTLAVWR